MESEYYFEVCVGPNSLYIAKIEITEYGEKKNIYSYDKRNGTLKKLNRVQYCVYEYYKPIIRGVGGTPEEALEAAKSELLLALANGTRRIDEAMDRIERRKNRKIDYGKEFRGGINGREMTKRPPDPKGQGENHRNEEK